MHIRPGSHRVAASPSHTARTDSAARPSAAAPAQVDSFEPAAQPATTTTAPAPAAAATPERQLVDSLLQTVLGILQALLAKLNAAPSTPATPPATGTTPISDPAPSAPTTAPTASTPSASPEDAYRKLIAADIQTAYGRAATDSDYSYWLPKLEGGCDSGFVTGGQMTSTEYWHRRMLGWQAGGSDAATSGPYAGTGDASGPVPSATDVVNDVPPGEPVFD